MFSRQIFRVRYFVRVQLRYLQFKQSLIVTLRFANLILWISSNISSVVISIGRLDRFSSKTDNRPRLNSLNQYLMVVIEGAWSFYRRRATSFQPKKESNY